MEAPRIVVKCGVTNCHYNKSRLCYADSIEVNPKGDDKAYTSEGTVCTTFINDDEYNR
jgi:hypothetical protein